MSRTDDASSPSVPPSLLSLAERAKREHGDVLAHDTPAPASVSLPSSTGEILKRLAAHSERAQRYELRGEIARGGMGAVLDVWEEDLHRSLAMKVAIDVEPAPAGHVSDRGLPKLARFLEEAQVTAQLDHPGIVPVHELGLDDAGRLYFTMKRVAGRTLAQVFELVAEERDGWNQTRALYALLKACDAVSYAHKKGVIHRDLKPANVMVGSFGEVYVMDWGLARVVGREDRHDMRLRPQSEMLTSVHTDRRGVREDTPNSPLMTMDGAVLGTPAYMSPEQARNEVERLGPRSDVYAIGAMLYHLLSGQAPYLPRGSRVASYVVLRWLLEGPPQPLHQIRPDLPAELGAICEKAMARDPAQRYADMRELADDLRAYLENRVVSAYETGSLAEMKKWIRRNKGVTSATAAGLLIAFAALTWVSIVESSARNEIEAKNELLQRSEALAQEAKRRAEDSAAVAREEQQRADRKAEEAAEQRVVAERAARDVLSFSQALELQNLTAEADALWPITPAMIPRYESWLARASALMQADSRVGETRTMLRVDDQERFLAELEARAAPPAAPTADAPLHAARAANIARLQAHRDWHGRMLGVLPWPDEDLVESSVRPQQSKQSIDELRAYAFECVGPHRTRVGEETQALLAARAALELAELPHLADRAPMIRNTLAWALFRLARHEDAFVVLGDNLAALPADHPRRHIAVEYGVALREFVMDWTLPDRRRQREVEYVALVKRASDAAKTQPRGYRLADASDQWRYEQIATLIDEKRAFVDPERGLYSSGASREHGWGIVYRLELARTIEERSVNGPTVSALWARAIESIADPAECPAYDGLRIRPQLGLLPIGRDPSSGLWEFVHVLTGDVPSRDESGRVVITPEMGIVLVLLPGATCLIGSQNDDASKRNYDLNLETIETLPDHVKLSAFFMSKYEMTQRQWQRLCWSNPAELNVLDTAAPDSHRPRRGYLTSMNPVDSVSWNDCDRTLGRVGLVLPTEAQWEYAARAGTSTPWWTGEDPKSLQGAANLMDRKFLRVQARSFEPWLNDGDDNHGEIGKRDANPFGLHDVVGNVQEWCLDLFSMYDEPKKLDTGERQSVGSPARMLRGGSFKSAAIDARSASRRSFAPDTRATDYGVRPARLLDK